ncbi:DUF1648 domain-containing protein [Saccharibacillus alkalitolerans]|uniref:DUF1648 domain-containing protein n=1 Tax=Saccharibacillus alkalitolerans TaxID=2705290 RepID=A0ABX0F3G9_9BACL|nr:DUF5808 domain-containing protein [Saccharibacillus alkalitolerans]NGZ74193.1 DUF1648 domain-containing protein [Saccharibacillus alkalitolerans]
MNPTTAFLLVAAFLDLLWLLSLIGLPLLASGMLIGVYVPQEERRLAQVSAIRRRYVGLSLGGALLGTLLAFAGWRLSGGSQGWTLALLLVPQALCAAAAWKICRSRALALKSERGWKAPSSSKRAAYIGSPRPSARSGIPAWAYLLHAAAIALCAVLLAVNWDRIPDPVPMHFDASGTPDRYAPKTVGSVYMLTIVQTLLTALFVGIHLSLGRTRQNLDPTDPEGSLRKRNKLLRSNAWLMYLLSLVVVIMLGWGQARSTYGFEGRLPAAYGIVFLTFIVLALLFFIVYLRRAGLEETGANRHRGEDRYWRGGLFYYNPEDPSFMSEKRFGMGWTLNFARPLSWAALAAGLLIPIAAIAAAVIFGS